MQRSRFYFLGVLAMALLLPGGLVQAELVMFFPFDGEADEVVNKHLVEVNGAPTYPTGKYGNCLSTNGTSDYLEIYDSPIMQDTFDGLDATYTITLWVKTTDTDTVGSSWYNFKTFMERRTPGSGEPRDWVFHAVINPAGEMRCHIQSYGAGASGVFDVYSTPERVNTGVWRHIALRHDGSLVSIWVDGVIQQEGVVNVTSSEIRVPGEDGMHIGARETNTGDPSEFIAAMFDNVAVWDTALTQEEILLSMTDLVEHVCGDRARNPDPADGEIDTSLDSDNVVRLSWTAGRYAATHNVYLGTSYDDVNSADTGNPLGVLVSEGQHANTFDPEGVFAYGQTYYWRVDEVNAPPTSHVVFKGEVWSFTVEPFAYPVACENVTATASSAVRAEEGPENTVNGSGLDGDDLHSSENTAMWLSAGAEPKGAWIQYEFDKVYKLYQMWVWNYNSSVEPLVGFGVKEAMIEYSVDGANWVELGTTCEFAKGHGKPGYAANTNVDLGGVSARHVRITANSNWGGIVNQYGLGEVRFLYIPVWAREPNPDPGAIDVGVDTTFSFRAGREAAKHDLYLSTDEHAVIDGSVPSVSLTESSYASMLDLASTYYWRIDEANDAETPPVWQGEIWSLSTLEYLVVDDFESYNEIPAGEEGSNLIYERWIDGFGVATNGSTVGYTVAFQPSMEKSIVHDGKQSVPLFYDNTTAAYSEVTASIAYLGVVNDWTKHAVKALTLRFSGDPANIAQRMYVKINGTKVAYDGSVEAVRLKSWQMWYIDLASVGVNVSNVTELSIGLDRIGATGGQGMVLLDAIRLYSYDRQLITPAEPGAAGLQAHYQFDDNTNDSSGNARHGTAAGNPIFGAGKVGQAIGFDGLGDYVNIDGYKGVLGSSAITVTAWIKTSSTDTGAIVGWGPNVAGQRFGFRFDAGRLRFEHQGGNVQGDSSMNDGAWHHVAVTIQENATVSYPEVILWLDGQDDTRVTIDLDPVFNLTAGPDVSIGRRPSVDDRYFIGSIDDVRIYDRVLSQEEVAWLAGRIEPFDEPF